MPVREFNTVISDGIRQLSQTTNITSFQKGAKARSYLESMAAELVSQSHEMQNEIREGRVSQATKSNLDKIADLFNVQRIRKEKAFSPLSDFNVRFTTDVGFANFNALSSLPSINIGDILQVDRSGNTRYVITELQGVLVGTSNVYYVGVKAQNPGANYNTAAKTIAIHPYNIPGLLVSNKFPIVNGTNVETDEQFRFRIFHAIRSLEACNDKALYIAARIVPGVGDVRIFNNLFGIGTCSIMIRPTNGLVTPNSMIEQVRANTSSVKAASTVLYVTSPDVVGFELELDIKYRRILTATEKNIIGTNVVNQVAKYFSNLNPGDSVSFRQIISQAASVSQDILSIGKDNKLFGRCWVYFSDKPGRNVSRRREELVVDNNLTQFSIEQYELPGLEPSLATPVRVRHIN